MAHRLESRFCIKEKHAPDEVWFRTPHLHTLPHLWTLSRFWYSYFLAYKHLCIHIPTYLGSSKPQHPPKWLSSLEKFVAAAISALCSAVVAATAPTALASSRGSALMLA